MSAWLNRNKLSRDENGLEDHRVPVHAHSSRSSRSSPKDGPSHGITTAVAPLFGTRSKLLGTLLYVGGTLAILLFVHNGWLRLPYADVQALDRIALAGGVLVLTLWLFPWHRFGRNVLLIPVSACLILTTFAVYFSGGWRSPLSVLYLLVVVFCAGYFSAGLAALCVAATLLASMSPQLYTPDAARLIQHVIVQVPTYIGLTLACRYTLWERASLQFEHDSEEIEDLKERLWQEASLDTLTGLYNRSRFEARFQEEFERAKREEEQFIVLFLDVDDFKEVNDNHGHRMGDDALKLIAEILQSSSRRVDVVARHGGDEFMVILSGASLPEAHRYFERIRRQVSERSSRTLGLNLRLSAGAVQCPDNSSDPAALLETADEAMYKAKRHGKNRLFAALSLAPAERRRAMSKEEESG
jgi:diguanylate cyclase (GGDEF)-like protein